MKQTEVKTTPESKRSFILVGSRKGCSRDRCGRASPCVTTALEVEAAISGHVKRVTWISFTRRSTEMLLEEAVDAGGSACGGLRGSHLITLVPPRLESIAALLGLFQPVFGLVEGFEWLPHAELVEAITSDDASDRFIGGSVDRKSKTLTLLRGDITATWPRSGCSQNRATGRRLTLPGSI